MKARRIFTAIAGAAVASSVAGIAYATIPDQNNVYSACMLKGLGTIRLIDKSLPTTNLMSHCTDKEIEISWNQAGQPGPAGPQGAKGDPGPPGKNGANGTNGTDGKDGVSVTTAPEASGANCATGGVQLTAANGVTYVCNGKAGADGKDGVGVTSAIELPGSNCANGGSSFTAANRTTYACNGAPGSAGTGLPQAYTKTDGTDITFGASTPGTVVIIALSVPAGSYFVHGTLAVYNTGPSVNEAQCRIVGFGTPSVVVRIPNDSYTVPFDLAGVVQVPVAGEIQLTCTTGSSIEVLKTSDETLTAVAVALMP